MTLTLVLVAGILAAGCWGRWTWALGAAVAAAMIQTIVLREVGGAWVALQVGVLLALPLVPWSAERAAREAQQVFDVEQLAARQRVVALRAELDDRQRTHETLADDINQLIELYRVTKETAGEVRLPGLVEQLTKLLSTTLPFERWSLLLLAARPESPAAATEVWQADVRGAAARPLTDVPGWQAPLLERLRRDPQPRWVRDGAADGLPGLSREAAWIPLLSQERLRGVLVFERLPQSAFHRAQIIAHQVTLQLERVLLYQDLERLAVSDSLTELPVRRFFLKRLQDELARAQRHGTPAALLMLDLDWFKRLNDTYGHLVGDEVLRRVGALLKANVREIDLLARYGGEEFVLHLVDTNAEAAGQVAERIRRVIEEQSIRAYDETVRVTVSMGIALCPQHGTTPTELLEHADQALYQAKAAGRNRVTVYQAAGGGA